MGQTTGVLGEDIACCSQESISNRNLTKGVQIKIQGIYVSVLPIGSRCLSLEAWTLVMSMADLIFSRFMLPWSLFYLKISLSFSVSMTSYLFRVISLFFVVCVSLSIICFSTVVHSIRGFRASDFLELQKANQWWLTYTYPKKFSSLMIVRVEMECKRGISAILYLYLEIKCADVTVIAKSNFQNTPHESCTAFYAVNLEFWWFINFMQWLVLSVNESIFLIKKTFTKIR
jgi:hypothetical protein